MDILNIGADLDFETSVTGIELRTHEAYAGTKFDNTDEIKITIENQDAYTLPCRSFIYMEGKLTTSTGAPVSRTILTTNPFAYLISECRYLLNGIEIDQTRNVGYTSSMKGLASFSPGDARTLDNAGWDQENAPTVHTDGSFTAILPLRTLMGFFEDYRRILVNCKQELVLIRSQNDLNCIISEPPVAAVGGVGGVPLERTKITITKLNWRMHYVDVSVPAKLQLLRELQSDKPIQMGFRSWHACEMPLNPNVNKIEWQMKTSTQMERPRYALLALQTNKRNNATANAFNVDHCKVKNVKLYLNGKSFPYSDLNLNITKKNGALLWEMFTGFRDTYYGKEKDPMITQKQFMSNSSLIVIDCSMQNEAVKSGAVDVRLDIESESDFPDNTTAFCVILHDRVVDYTPLTNIVTKHN
jgi:hypothetical protein